MALIKVLIRWTARKVLMDSHLDQWEDFRRQIAGLKALQKTASSLESNLKDEN